jgi:hypothetical protein
MRNAEINEINFIILEQVFSKNKFFKIYTIH